MKKKLLIGSLSAWVILAGSPTLAENLPEIIVSPDTPCVLYVNRYQEPTSNTITLDVIDHEVVFTFYRGFGYDPDTLVVFVPSGAIFPDKERVTLEELKSEEICFSYYQGF